MLYTVLKPDEGSATIDGIDVITDSLAARRRIGALPHGAGLYPHLSARENIAYYARLCGLEKDILEEQQKMTVRVRLHGGEAHKLDIRINEPLSILYQIASEALDVPLNRLELRFEGDVLNKKETGEWADLDDDVLIDARVLQVGARKRRRR